jgi:hypothetical protein
MENKTFGVNIDAEAVKTQYDAEQESVATNATQKKTQFDTKNYLQARLGEKEDTKTLTIRLLPFSPEGGTPFFKVHMHTVKVNREIAPNGWKTFVCPTHNKKNGKLMGEKCPFCDISSKARELKSKALDEPTKKKYGDIEFLNRVKEMWIVRCIERGHEEDGVKFWMFASSPKKKDGVFDKIMTIANQRAASAAKKGNKYSIFDLNNGMDLIVTLNKTADKKTTIQILDEGMPSPLSEDFDKGMEWINDSKKWDEVYTLKPYEYMSIVAQGSVPIYNKEAGKYISKEEEEKLKQEAEAEKVKEETKPKKDFSEITEKQEKVEIVNGNDYETEEDGDSLPF